MRFPDLSLPPPPLPKNPETAPVYDKEICKITIVNDAVVYVYLQVVIVNTKRKPSILVTLF
jgi:hypothetical protein